jgi:Tfp pilus assembly protein PilX
MIPLVVGLSLLLIVVLAVVFAAMKQTADARLGVRRRSTQMAQREAKSGDEGTHRPQE